MAEYPGLGLFPGRSLSVGDALSLSGSRQNLDEVALRAHVADAGYAGWALFDEAVAQLLAAWHHGGECQRLLLANSETRHFARNLQRCHASLACPDSRVWRESRASGCRFLALVKPN